MSWSTRILSPAMPRRLAYWAIHLGVSAFALWGAWAWIEAVSASDATGGTPASVVSDRATSPRWDRDNLALQCAATDEIAPVGATSAESDLGRKSYSTVWLQEGQSEKAGIKIRGMSRMGAAPKDPVTQIVEAGRPEAITAPLEQPRAMHRTTGPVVRPAQTVASKPTGASTIQAIDAPVAKISWPSNAPSASTSASRQDTAQDDEPVAPVAEVATRADKRETKVSPPVVAKAPAVEQEAKAVPSPVLVVKLPGEDAAAARAAATAPKQQAPHEAPETSKTKVVSKPIESKQRIAMRGGVKTSAAPIAAAPAKPQPSEGTWNPEALPVVEPPKVAETPFAAEPEAIEPVAPAPVPAERVASKPVTAKPAAERVATVAPAATVARPVVAAPVATPPVKLAPINTTPSATLVSQPAPTQAYPSVAAAGPHAASPVQTRPVAQPALPPPPVSTPYVSSEESRHLAIISKRAQEHVDYGFDLAERGALYSAELEFSQALQLVAQALDAYHHNQKHSKAVAAGLTALREADDFVPRAGQPPIKLEDAIAGHKTPVWRTGETEDVPPLIAMQRYYAYAQQQFMVAAGKDQSAAMALYGMGRLQTSLANEYGVKKVTAGPKAMALYQATIGVDPQNYLAANELGVMLARYGQLRDAEAVLRQSVAVAPRPENLKNLSEVYERMGDPQSAQNARTQQMLAMQSGTRPGRQTTADRPPLKLVDNVTFQQDSGAVGADDILTAEKTDGKTAANATKTADSKESKKSLGWIGDKVSEGMTRVVNPKQKPAQVR